ncbi:hypothetical protein GE09DRAFT_1074161 [Coniochaeta sp. 2T2.1]|nr:hypothetical protein GE09DRAFT_1074161 [Coniochaeta sp. 2T2.1]
MDPSCPPPPSPSPWRWQCHRCRIWYTLSCTRRCLSCSHVFCQETLNGHNQRHNNNSNTTDLPPSPSSSPRLRRQSQIRARCKSKKKGGPCTSKYDFDGWAAWGSWRRMTLLRRRSTTTHNSPKSYVTPLLNRREYITTTSRPSRKREMEPGAYMTWKLKEVSNMHDNTKLPKQQRWAPRCLDSQTQVLRRKEEMYLFAEHDCSLHCDYPNECGHTVYAAGERERERIREGLKEEEEVEDEEVLMPWSTGAEFEIYCDPVLATDANEGVNDNEDANGKEVDMESEGDTEDMEERDEIDEKAAEELASLFSTCTNSSPKSSERGLTGHAEADEYLDWISNEWDE